MTIEMKLLRREHPHFALTTLIDDIKVEHHLIFLYALPPVPQHLMLSSTSPWS